MKKRILAIVSGLGILLGLSSCFQVEQLLTLKKDGSATFEEEVLMSAQMVGMMGMQAGQDGGAAADPLADMMKEDQYKEKAAAYGEGVTFVKVEKVNKNGWQGAKVTYKVADINKFKLSPGSALDDLGAGGEEADEKPEDPVLFTYKGGELTIKFPEMAEGEIADVDVEDAPVDPQAEAMMKGMFAEMKITSKMAFEPGIASTNATHRDGDTITVMEMNFGEIIQNPQGMSALQKMEGMSRKQTEKLLEGIKGVKVETKEEVTVKLK